MNLWVPVLVACVGSYLIKLAGLSLPESVLANPKVQRVTTMLPVAMLAALVAVQLVESGDGPGPYALVVAVAVTALLRLLVPGA